MEKRKQPRTKVGLEVEFARFGIRCSQHKTHDIGLGGMFVDRGNGNTPKVGDEVEVKFIGDDSYSMRARVVRENKYGFALIFVDFNIEDLMFLEEPLKRQQKISPSHLH